MQCQSIAILRQDYNIWFRLLLLIAKDLSKHHKTRHYRHGEPDFAMKGIHQISISFTVAYCLKVSLNMVQCNSINSMFKLVLWHFG
jgi:hypothetical protein